MIALFACLFIGHQLVLLWTRRRFDPFDVKVLIDVVLMAMWVFAPLVDSSLRIRLENDLLFAFTTFLGVLFLYAGLHLPTGKRQPVSLWLSEAPVIRTRWLWLALFFFVAATLLLTNQRIQRSGAGVLEYLTGDRLSDYGRFLNEENEGSALNVLITFMQPVVLLWLAILLERRRWGKAVFLYLTLLIGILLIATVRLPIIITLFMPLFYYYRSRNRPVPIWAALGGAVIFLLLMFLLNTWRGQGLDSVRSIELSLNSVLGSTVSNFNPLRGYEMLWQLAAGHQLSYEYGLTYLYVPLTVVPRALWENKPLVSFEPRWTTHLFGQHFAMTSEGWGVWTFTVWGEGLVQFGVLGVFLNLFLYGGLIAWIDNRISHNLRFSLVWFYYSILAATYLRSSFSALAWTSLATFLPTILVYYLSIRSQRPFVAPAEVVSARYGADHHDKPISFGYIRKT